MIEVFGLLQDKLDFIKRFYQSAAGPFEEDMRKIDSHEPPYDRFDPEDGAPPYLSEWLDNKESLNLLGKACLCLVQNAFKKYLEGFIKRSAQEGLLHEGNKIDMRKVQGNWFKKYQEIFLEHFRIDWQGSSALSLVEEVNLTRNTIEHGGTYYDLEHRQNDKDFSRFPDSIFADEFEREVLNDVNDSEQFYDEDGNVLDTRYPCRILITEEKLSIAIHAIEEFCSYLEKEWEKHPM